MTQNIPGHQVKIIVVGNEKGGSGKSTSVMHIITALLGAGHSVGCLDLDARQATLSHYVDNRKAFMERKSIHLTMPEVLAVLPSTNKSVPDAQKEDFERVEEAVSLLSARNDFVVIDTPGANTPISRIGHSYADILVTPLNDSFVDLDVLAKIDPENLDVVRPSSYGEMVFQAKMLKAKRSGSNRTFEWVVMRNRTGQLESRNQQAMENALERLAKRVGFRVIPGFSERVIFRELFLDGLTVLDAKRPEAGIRMSMSHVSARNEIHGLMRNLGLPVNMN